ncbi:cytochrome c oxidase subunit 1 [Linnemannia zychae]|nr:cytochrome c oxidase subunit 1 [Linnemannia zychae]
MLLLRQLCISPFVPTYILLLCIPLTVAASFLLNSYETFKVLRVRDRRLGGLYRLFQATILLYIASSIIFQQRYLKTENIINGAVRVTLKAPVDGIATTPGYCKPSSSISHPSIPESAPPCLYWSSNDVLYEPGVNGALITTRAQVTQYGPFNNQSTSPQQNCDVNVPFAAGCDPYSAPTTLLLPTSLVADIERFTLMLEHSIRGQASGVQLRSGNMEYGLLRDSESGQILKTFTDQSRYVMDSTTKETVSQNGSNVTTTATINGNKMVHLAGDVMTVGEFLKAAGVNLDDLSKAPSASVNETVRSSGVVVIVVIQYAAKGWNPNKISYEYLPKAIPDQEYKVIETIRDFRGGNRVEINRHGIRIVFSQAGQLGQFSFMTLLTNLVAAVALFKVANIIVELMMLRLHPQKKVYGRAKFEHTKDGMPPLKREDSENDNVTTLEELAVGQEESQRESHSSIRGQLQDEQEGDSSRTVTPGSSTTDLEDGKMTGRTTGASRQHSATNGFSRRNRSCDIDEEAAPQNHQGDPADYTTDSDDSDDSDDDIKRDRRRFQVQDSVSMAQSSSVDPTRSQLRVVVSRQSSSSPTDFSNKDNCRSATTPISTNGTVGRQQGSQLTKVVAGSTTAMSGVDWNRNGSSSALSGGDVTPGVARASTAIRASSSFMYGLGQGYGAVTPRESSDDIEIETRFGPVRPNEYKGFNPGGLSLTGTPPLSPSPSQMRYAFGSMRRGSATPERSTAYGISTPSPTRSGEGFSAFRSPASMQAASPSPVFFNHHHHHHHHNHQGSNVGRQGSISEDSSYNKSSRCKKNGTIMKSTGLPSPSSPHEGTRTLRTLHSSSSLSSLSSSSSSTSLASFYEGVDQKATGAGVGLSLGLSQGGSNCSGSQSLASTWSNGAPDNPLRGEFSGVESLYGSGPHSTSTHHCSKKGKSSRGGREHKKRRKEYSQTSPVSGRYELPLQSKSEINLSRPMFGLGSSSNMSSFSLSLTGTSATESSSKDAKGKQVDSKWSVEGSTSSLTPTATSTTTTAFNVSMTPFQPPMPACFSQGMSTKLVLEETLAGLSSSSTSSTPISTSNSSGKQPQRGASLRHTLRASVSSPSLLTGHRDAAAAVAAGLSLPLKPQLASHSDLPPKSGTIEPSLILSRSESKSEENANAGESSTQTQHTDQVTPQESIGMTSLPTLSTTESTSNVQPSSSPLDNAVFHTSGNASLTTADAGVSILAASSTEVNVTRASTEYVFNRTTSSAPTSTTTRAVPLPLRPILSTSTHLHSHHQQHPLDSTADSTAVAAAATTTTTVGLTTTPDSGISSAHSFVRPITINSSPNGFLSTSTQSATTTATSLSSSSSSTSARTTGSKLQQPYFYPHPTSTFFTSPITSSCTTTLPESGIRVLGPTITMITADNRKLVLRRSAPLVLNEGVGEEKAARM